MIMEKAIQVNNLSKYFFLSKKEKKGSSQGAKNVIRAVDNISFEVNNGEIFGFLGPNGAGKTTTIRMLTSALKPTEGDIIINNYNLRKNLIKVKQLMGHVPEEANVYIDLTGFQNLAFIGELYGVSKKEITLRAENLLNKFELFDKRNLKAKKYSKGMKQRLLLCMALMSDPKILFLDEPTSGLDVKSSIIIKKLIKEYNKLGMTIFLTTHDMDVANELCDHIAIINKGRIVGLDTPENLKKISQEYQAIDCCFENDIEINQIKELNTVLEIQKINKHYHIIVKDINEAVFEVVDYIKENKLKIKELSTHQPKLEEAFLKILERGEKN
jgi:ABC-2 type transport system ATP-binding protein